MLMWYFINKKRCDNKSFRALTMQDSIAESKIINYILFYVILLM